MKKILLIALVALLQEAGDLTDNPSKERKGRSQQNLGEKQREYGEALDQARDINATRH